MIVPKVIKYLVIYLTETRHTGKITKYPWKRLKNMLINGKIFDGHTLDNLLLLRWLYSPLWSTDMKPLLSRYQMPFYNNLQANPQIYIEMQVTPKAKIILKKKHRVQELIFQFQNLL